ncbi:MAG: hypothetical protein KDA63_14375 [Planctomycetales bacterium]|nr:hypothetical protein [Planctomycetales bacterium]
MSLALMGFAAVAVFNISSCMSSNNQDDVAVYEHAAFYSSPHFTTFVSPPSGNTSILANVYIEIPDGRRFLLAQLPANVTSEILGVDGWEYDGELNYSDSHSHIEYRDGQLVMARISGDSEKFRIGPTEDGPFLSFPIERDQLIEVFGEPVRWKRLVTRYGGA